MRKKPFQQKISRQDMSSHRAMIIAIRANDTEGFARALAADPELAAYGRTLRYFAINKNDAAMVARLLSQQGLDKQSNAYRYAVTDVVTECVFRRNLAEDDVHMVLANEVPDKADWLRPIFVTAFNAVAQRTYNPVSLNDRLLKVLSDKDDGASLVSAYSGIDSQIHREIDNLASMSSHMGDLYGKVRGVRQPPSPRRR